MMAWSAEWLRCSVSDHARSTRVGSDPIVEITNHKPTVNSAVIHPRSVNEYSKVTLSTSTGHTLIRANHPV